MSTESRSAKRSPDAIALCVAIVAGALWMDAAVAASPSESERRSNDRPSADWRSADRPTRQAIRQQLRASEQPREQFTWYDALLDRAEDFADQPPVSVTDKTLTPPSGDKHDYLSLAPYWWPNPDTDDGLPYVRRDGRVNPEARSDSTDYGRKTKMFRRVETLAYAAYYSGEQRYADAAVEQLETWFVDPTTRMNPHLEHAQCVRGRDEGRCFGIIEWTRIGRLLFAIELLAESNQLPDTTRSALDAWFGSYLDWLTNSKTGREERDRHNNHGTWYDVQVVTLLQHFNRREAAIAVLEAAKDRIASQIEPDGRQPHELARTKSLSYSKMNLRAFQRLAEYGEQLGVDLTNYETPDGRSIRAAESFLRPYLRGEKKWPYRQLDDEST